MASKFETSYGARLRKLQDVIAYAKTWQGFQPPRTEESVPELENLVATALNANTQETAIQQEYSQAVQVRQDHFTKVEGSFLKLLTPLRAAVDAQYGRQSDQSARIAPVIKKLRASKLIKLPADPASGKKEQTISQSERSYGSIIQYFTDMVTIMDGFGNYTHSNSVLTVQALKQKITDAHAANDAVAQQLQQLKTSRNTRSEIFKDLADRLKRVKYYVKSQYGTKSPQYNSLVELGV